jgi:L-ascorbate metabolism protein UlaG (beta-lactamase superfamily)
MRRPLLLALVFAFGCASVPRAPRSEVTLTYLGVAGWSISDGRHTVLLDPYFSRPADPWNNPVPDERAVAAKLPARVDLIAVGHAHVDHALDAPLIAKLSGAPLMGSAELIQQARAFGLPDKDLLLVNGGEDYERDGFSIRVIPSLHSVIGLENKGDIRTLAYLVRMGGQEILVLDTANFVERELDGLRPDVIVVAPGLREKVHAYACRLMRATGEPPLAIATHFDNWQGPVDAPLSTSTKEDLRKFEAELRACAPRLQFQVPAPFAPIVLPRTP